MPPGFNPYPYRQAAHIKAKDLRQKPTAVPEPLSSVYCLRQLSIWHYERSLCGAYVGWKLLTT
ncbi:hypothetical protein J6590_027300 [Homalodisca vitripennis]|nr:hypothetical protein J6590_027300 [Homalodisca vitripennis]